MILLLVLFFGLLLLIYFFKGVVKRRLVSYTFPINRMPSGEDGQLRVLTYNIAGLPQGISKALGPRKANIELIGGRIDAFDIVNVQEDFNYNPSLCLYNKHPYRMHPKGRIPIGDGLNTLSFFPIVEYHRIPWRDCNGADCWTPKGFSLARILLADKVTLDVYNVHETAGNSGRSARARRKNMLQLAQFIQDHSKGRALLVFGDFNANYTSHLDNLSDFVSQTGLRDSWVELIRKGVMPEVEMGFVFRDMHSYTDDVESIDKIYYRSTDQLSLQPMRYKVETDLFKNDQGQPLSDHLAVSVMFAWQYVK